MVRGALVAVLGGILAARAYVQRPKPVAKAEKLSIGAAAKGGAFCPGEYADDLSVLSAKAREFEQNPKQQYTHCVRTSAIYECISYGADGNLRRNRRKAVAHGTAFAYRQQNGETLLLTNDHVAEWPAVTDDEHRVDDIPLGCKRVSDSLRIVENESDAYERDDIPLTRVATDPQLDMAVLKAHTALPTMPWKIGRSAALRERNVVDVRGFPLGAFKATTTGKVITAYDHDDEKDWDHDDFVVDAALSPGNSGSPVFAVSCKTGEPELVGVFHAGYTAGSSLNVVVGIEQVRDLMTTLKRSPKAKPSESALDGKARAQLVEDSKALVEPYFPFGNLPAVVRARPDGALVFEVMSKEFPLKAHPIMAFEDLPGSTPEEFGRLGRIWFGNRQGLKAFGRSELDADAQAQMTHLLESLRHDALVAFDYRMAAKKASTSREHFNEMAKLERALRRGAVARVDLSSIVVDLADRLSPHGADVFLPVADLFSSPLPVTAAASSARQLPAAAPPSVPR